MASSLPKTLKEAFAQTTLVLAGHGSSRHPGGAKAVLSHTEALEKTGLFKKVLCAFWKEPPFLKDLRDRIGEEKVYIVPVLASQGQITETVFPRELGLTDSKTDNFVLCAPVGIHPKISQSVAERALALAEALEIRPSETSLILVGHGSGSGHPGSALQTEAVAKHALKHGAFKEVKTAYLEQAPRIEDWATETSGRNVIVIPFMISGGLHAAQDIPEILGFDPNSPDIEALSQDAETAGPLKAEGRTLWLTRPVGSEPFMVDLIIDQVIEAFNT